MQRWFNVLYSTMKLTKVKDKPPASSDDMFNTATTSSAQPLTSISYASSSSSSPYVTPKKGRSPSAASLMSHIYVLYSVVVVLSGSQMATLWFGSCRLNYLQRQIDDTTLRDWEDVYAFIISQNVSNLDASSFQDYRNERVFTREEFLKLWTAKRKEENIREGREGHDETGPRLNVERSRRNAERSSKDSGGEWAWESNSFSRFPRSEAMRSAMQGYCREAQLFCAAEGKPGPPGRPGDKGRMGNPGIPGGMGPKGDKGYPSDPLMVAQNMGMLDMRGPPGPKGEPGDKGEKGDVGTMGPRGPSGRSGMPGRDGQQGIKGDPGERGDKGMRGLIGFPGIKGEPGSPGPSGDRGESGYDGEDGKRGRRGEPGPPGPPGPKGTPGIPGLPGFKGYKGDMGTMGPRGPKGERGDDGRCPAMCMEPRKPRTTTLNTTPKTWRSSASGARMPCVSHPVLLFLLLLCLYVTCLSHRTPCL